MGEPAVPSATTIASICPGCGQPRLLAGNAPRVRCATCGQDHAVEPELARAAEAYRLARANLPLQLAQSADIDAISAESNLVAHRFRVAAGVLSGPLLVLAVVGLVLRSGPFDDTHRWGRFFTPTFETPLLALVGTGAVAWWLLRRRRGSIERLLWARSLEDAPGVLACRMCGGPLEARAEASAVVSCRYCHADNMVGPEVSAAAAKLALTDYVAHASSVLDGATKRATTVVARIALLVPLLALLVAGLAQRSAWRRLQAARGPANAVTSYQAVHCREATQACLHRVGEDVQSECYGGPPTVTVVHAAELVGRPIVESDVVWDQKVDMVGAVPDLHVVGVASDGLGRNHVRAEGAFGMRGDGLIEGLCVVTAADGGAP